MSILTKPDIIACIETGLVTVTSGSIELTAEQMTIGPNSIDLHLHPSMKVYEPRKRLRPNAVTGTEVVQEFMELDAREENPTRDITITEKGYVLSPNQLYLGRTVERTNTPHHVPMISGRSSTGRLGICVHQTAGLGDIGFDGTWTLEISCRIPVRVYPVIRIAQLWLFSGSSQLSPEDKYSGRYQGQQDATGYKGHE